jgi:multimeric flavodoxin WrbA
MPVSKIVLLDGSINGDRLTPSLAALTETLHHSGASVQVFRLQEIKLGHCVGCFGCWIKTPGICVQNDAGRQIAAAVIRSDITVLFSPIVFGGYSPDLKRAIDRFFSPLLQPYMGNYRGETHHVPRYTRYPRLVSIGVQRQPEPEEAELFRLISGRNALNLHAPSYASEICNCDESPELLRQLFEGALMREDTFPLGNILRSINIQTDVLPRDGAHNARRKALLLLGSPKAKPGTSARLGNELLERLQGCGWETENLKLKASLRTEKGRAGLMAAVEGVDLLLLAFPLYNDAPPVFVLEAMQAIAARRRNATSRQQRLAVVVNNGFPEAHYDIPAIAVCRRFARESGIEWAGGLALGAGEAFNDGQPLTGRRSLLSARNILKALDLAATALGAYLPIPDEAVRLIGGTPVPFSPFSVWRWIYIRKAGRHWQEEAARNNLANDQMLARPFLIQEG